MGSNPRTRRCGLRSALGAMALAAVATRGAGAAPDGVKLELKPSRQPTEYWVHNADRVIHEGGKQAPKDFTSETWVHLSRRADDLGGGRLRIHSDRLDQRMAVNGTVSKALAFKKESTSYECNRQGLREDRMEEFDPTVGFAPIFPTAVVKPGQGWTVGLPPSSLFPFPFTVVHKLEKLETVRGAECAVIRSRVRLEGTEPRTKVAFEVRVDMETVLSLAAGEVVRSHSVTHFSRKHPSPFSGDHDTLRRIVTRTVRARGPSDAGPPELR